MLKILSARRFHWIFDHIFCEGRRHELRDREKAHELYLQIKSEVEKCIGFLKEKRETDPYRNILARLSYQATNGSTSQVPTFDIWFFCSNENWFSPCWSRRSSRSFSGIMVAGVSCNLQGVTRNFIYSWKMTSNHLPGFFFFF